MGDNMVFWTEWESKKFCTSTFKVVIDKFQDQYLNTIAYFLGITVIIVTHTSPMTR